MIQEEKELLLKDLCARLPYGVHCCVLNLNKTIKEDNDIIYGIIADNIVTLKSDKNECYMYYQIKPYLRPMSSMTEEEKLDYQAFFNYDGIEYPEEYIDWLNSHLFDYRGLIGRGLGIEAPEGMYTHFEDMKTVVAN